MKLWGGRFAKPTDATLEEFGASIYFDQAFWREDILGSMAHVRGLARTAVLTQEEADQICHGLHAIWAKIEQGIVVFSVADEDIHMNIERLLFEEIGELAGKVHTGRSRNDQSAFDMHLYMRRKLVSLIENCYVLQQHLLSQAEKNIEVIFPAYTHLQQAQPIRFAHHWLAYVWMLDRDMRRLQQNFISTNTLPLGAGAVVGSSFPLAQEWVARSLHFDAIYQNSMDAVSDRDYLVEFLSAAALIMTHLSKLCEELILWSTQEFAYIEIDDAFSTGSSMMPQKKNPDAAELIRGKTGRVYGSLMAMFTVLKSLPLAYNKDLQEDKEGVFDTLNTVDGCLTMMSGMISTLKVKQAAIQQSLASGFLSATELANYLVKRGLTFRQAHEILGQLVKHCTHHAMTLADLDLPALKQFSSLFAEDVADLFVLEKVVEYQSNIGGTARNAVLAQIGAARKRAKEVKDWLEMATSKINVKCFLPHGG